MPDDTLNPMANDAGWPHITTDLRAENAKLCAEIGRLRAALTKIRKLADGTADTEAPKALNTIGHIADEALSHQQRAQGTKP